MMFKDCRDFGYKDFKTSHDGFGSHLQAQIMTNEKRKKSKTKLPPYPNSWYYVIESSDLPRNAVREINILGSFDMRYKI